MFLSRGDESCDPSGDHPSWLHAWHSYNPTMCQSQVWDLCLFCIIIAPMAKGWPTNTPAFRRLHHPKILYVFRNSRGGITAEAVQTTCLFLSGCLSVWITLCLCIWPGCSSLYVCLSTTWNSCPLVFLSCLSFNLAAHYCYSVRGHSSFISSALCCYVAKLFQRPL